MILVLKNEHGDDSWVDIELSKGVPMFAKWHGMNGGALSACRYVSEEEALRDDGNVTMITMEEEVDSV